MYFGVEKRLEDLLGFIPWVGWPEYLVAVVVDRASSGRS